MEQSSSYDELTVMHQFDRKCKLALEGERIDYERHIMYRRKHEILFSEMSEKESCSLFVMDEYELEKYCFQACGYDVEVKDVLLAEALKTFFMEMSDADIARHLQLVRSTVHEHRTRSLKLLKNMMEKSIDENKEKKG